MRTRIVALLVLLGCGQPPATLEQKVLVAQQPSKNQLSEKDKQYAASQGKRAFEYLTGRFSYEPQFTGIAELMEILIPTIIDEIPQQKHFSVTRQLSSDPRLWAEVAFGKEEHIILTYQGTEGTVDIDMRLYNPAHGPEYRFPLCKLSTTVSCGSQGAGRPMMFAPFDGQNDADAELRWRAASLMLLEKAGMESSFDDPYLTQNMEKIPSPKAFEAFLRQGRTDFSNTSLVDLDLRKVDFFRYHQRHGPLDFTASEIIRVNFSGAYLKGAAFRMARIIRTDFSYTEIYVPVSDARR